MGPAPLTHHAVTNRPPLSSYQRNQTREGDQCNDMSSWEEAWPASRPRMRWQARGAK
ncbi:hypothetical protein SBA4_2480006 [Candidatus Sulfopaludibacter sp. SbA4]|nr:hypothetical protein SBA4_2480006 [Candidatus Sulfopaludibacter sp. SbA4]